MTYVFSSTQPPLLRDFPAILSVPQASLKSQVYTSNQQPNSPIIYNDSQHDHWQTYNSFTINRYQIWRLNSPPYHVASSGSRTHTVTTGYEDSQMTQFVKTISATAGASGFGMSAEVTGTLQLTSGETQSWSTSTTDSTQSEYDAATTYVSWTLYEHLEVLTQNWYQYEYKGDSPPGYTKQGDPQLTFVEIAILNFDDSLADPTAQFVPSINALLAHTGGSLHPV
ncbi:MAG: hypothetical protein HY254_24890 [Burkholderiales bacterium]|nr:hypothetical protein [Burkholderiales bacterium]